MPIDISSWQKNVNAFETQKSGFCPRIETLYSIYLSQSFHNHLFKLQMDTEQWLDDIDIEDIIPAIVLGVVQGRKCEHVQNAE